MREFVTLEKLEQFMLRLGRSATSPGVVYLVGGSTSLLLGIRPQTIDIDIKLEPEPGGVFEAIGRLKEELNVNVELAAPDQFVPPLPGWKDRSPLIQKAGMVEFRRYDLYTQALAKLERGHAMDWVDLSAYVDRGLISKETLKRLFDSVKDDIIRYPAIDSAELSRRVQEFVNGPN